MPLESYSFYCKSYTEFNWHRAASNDLQPSLMQELWWLETPLFGSGPSYREAAKGDNFNGSSDLARDPFLSLFQILP
jgi:hypothetical protein